MWLLHYCSPCLHSAKPKLQRNHQKRLEIFALASNVSAFYTSCLEKRFRSCWLEWKQVSSWWLTGSLRSLPDLLSILPRPQGAFPPYEVLPLQILTGAFPLFFRSHQPTCWLEWDWPCTATGQVPYPAPATQVEYNRSFPSCLQLKVQEYFLGHWGVLSPESRARNDGHVSQQGGSSQPGRYRLGGCALHRSYRLSRWTKLRLCPVVLVQCNI